jgi:hypothetical protein
MFGFGDKINDWLNCPTIDQLKGFSRSGHKALIQINLALEAKGKPWVLKDTISR